MDLLTSIEVKVIVANTGNSINIICLGFKRPYFRGCFFHYHLNIIKLIMKHLLYWYLWQCQTVISVISSFIVNSILPTIILWILLFLACFNMIILLINIIDHLLYCYCSQVSFNLNTSSYNQNFLLVSLYIQPIPDEMLFFFWRSTWLQSTIWLKTTFNSRCRLSIKVDSMRI